MFLNLAIGVIIGAAFGKVVTSLVNDIIMPPIGLLLGRVDFSNLFIDLSSGDYTTLADAKKAGAATLNYGLFFNTLLEFMTVSITVFLLVRQVNRLRHSKEKEVTTKECPYCISEIPLKAIRCPKCTSQL